MDQLFEKRWPSVILTPISILDHIVTVSSTRGLHPKQIVTLSLAGNSKNFEIKRILSETQLHLGTPNGTITEKLNPVEFNGGTLTYSEDERNPISYDRVLRSVYDEEPAVALRVTNVDWLGRHIDSVVDPEGKVRLAVDTVVSVGDLSVNIDYPNSFIIEHINAAAADTEFPIVIPQNTRKFTLRVFEDKSSLKIATSPGTSGTVYSKVSPGETWKSEELDLLAPFTIYAQCPKSNMKVILIRWV